MCCSFADRLRLGAAVALTAVGLLAGAANSAQAQAPLQVLETPTSDDALQLTISATEIRRVLVNGPEVLIQFARPIAPGAIESFSVRRAEWLETVEYGYDSLVLRFLPDLTVSAAAVGNGAEIRAVRPDTTASASSPTAVQTIDPQLVRLEYYRAVTLMETGAVRQGRAILTELYRADPSNIEVVLLLAQAEERLGRPKQAIVLMDRALELDPELPQTVSDKARLHREVADYARVSVRSQQVQDADTQHITVLDGRLDGSAGLAFDYRLENRQIKIDEARRSDGTLAPFDASRQFGAFRVAYQRADAPVFGTSLFTSRDGVGVGVDLAGGSGPALWKLEAALQEPEKDYIEGLIDGAARDHVGGTLTYAPSDTVSLTGGVSLNRYTVDEHHAGSSIEFTGEARKVVYAPWPFFSVGYRLDAEYFNQNNTTTAADGTEIDRLPMSSREAHSLDAGVEGYLTDYLRARAVGGYTYDRLNGYGPQADLEFVYEPLPDLEVTAGVGTSLAVSRGAESQLIFGGLSVRTRF